LGDDYKSTLNIFRSFESNHDTTSLHAFYSGLLSFSRTWEGHNMEKGYDITEEIVERESPYYGPYISLLSSRYLNDGRIRKCRRLIDRAGVVRDFSVLGPFDNISGSGYHPEHIDYSSPPDTGWEYTGKDKSKFNWKQVKNRRADGWFFTNNYLPIDNSVFYFYTDILSEAEKEVFLGFGASGSFKIFLNGDTLMADSVFRNCGMDQFIQKISLNKGHNSLFIKLCNEDESSNFIVRLMDKKGEKPDWITYSSNPADFNRTEFKTPENNLNPIYTSAEKNLRQRMEDSSGLIQNRLLLMIYYNTNEMFTKSRELGAELKKKFPESSYIRSLIAESYNRSGNTTRAQKEYQKAYNLSVYNSFSWHYKLRMISNRASSDKILEFINNSPQRLQDTPLPLFLKYMIYSKQGNQTALDAILRILKEKIPYTEESVSFLASVYSEKGKKDEAVDILEDFLDHKASSLQARNQLLKLHLHSGKTRRALRTARDNVKELPSSSNMLTTLYELSKKSRGREKAKKWLTATEKVSNRPEIHFMKGNYYETASEYDKALKSYKKSIDMKYDNFNAWKRIFAIEGKATPEDLTVIKKPSELIKDSKEWIDTVDSPKGKIVTLKRFIYKYPSGCSKERNILIVYMPGKKAIDTWKEYSIGYNPYYQNLSVNRALSFSEEGEETPADINRSQVVFKSLNPGDYLVLDWELENHYSSGMAGETFGSFSFDRDYPVFEAGLQMITPSIDTIPWRIQGSGISVSSKDSSIYRIIRFSSSPGGSSPQEWRAPVNTEESDKVHFSTIEDWKSVSEWYSMLTANKTEISSKMFPSLGSLTEEGDSERSIIKKVHSFITDKIRYSHVPFRQSAWVPEDPDEILASRLGDCKDMAVLGKAILDCFGINSSLVLVNTRPQNGRIETFTGPAFNHCILKAEAEDREYYIDFTDPYSSFHTLPEMDQGALALNITPETETLIHLPYDKPEDRKVVRDVSSTVDTSGTMTREIRTLKTGIFSSAMNRYYSEMSESKIRSKLTESISKRISGVVLDTLDFAGIKDSASRYSYSYTIEDFTKKTGNTVILRLPLPDRITGEMFPSSKERERSVDLTNTVIDIGTFINRGELKFPASWELEAFPESTSISFNGIQYNLNFTEEDSVLKYERSAVF
ncbi:MAG: hypothetical protein ACOCSE_04745, partial [Chitinivibrionales bacterium]